MDQITKPLTCEMALIDCMTIKEGGRGLTNIEYCIDGAIQGLKGYINKNKERLVTAASNSNKNKVRKIKKI